MKKHILSIILAAMLCGSLMPVSAAAEEFVQQPDTDITDVAPDPEIAPVTNPDEGIEPVVGAEPDDTPTVGATENRTVLDSGDTQHGVHWTLYEDGALVLTPKQKNTSFTYWLDKGDDAWSSRVYTVNGKEKIGKELVTSLVVEDRVGIIPVGMFSGYNDLKSVTLPGMYDIPKDTFLECRGLNNVTVNGSLHYIQESAFQSCTSLNTVEIKGDAGHICNHAFDNCILLKSFTVDGTVSSLGECALRRCGWIKTFDAPITGNIGNYAFEGCDRLYRLSPIRGSVGYSAFSWVEKPDDPGNYWNTSISDLYIVSSHNGTLETLNWNIKQKINLHYTGTKEEFEKRYKNGSGFKVASYQQIGANVTWTLEDGVLTISGSGSTIDLLEMTEQPWVNIPDKGSWDDQWEAIKKVKVDPRIEFGTHMLDNMEKKIEYIDNDDDDTPSVGAGSDTTIPEDVTDPSEPTGEDIIVGGWEFSDISTDNVDASDKALLEEALQETVGVTYEPKAVIASQIVAGKNLAFLCKATPVTLDPVPHWAIVSVYVDLNGKASLKNIADVDPADMKVKLNADEPMPGSWQSEADEKSVALTECVEKAISDISGVTYSPIAVLGTQLVAGRNYCILAYGTTVTANPMTNLYVINVYENLDDTAEITSISPLDLTAYTEREVQHALTDEELMQWAEKDYKDKTGNDVTADITGRFYDSYEITLSDDEGNILDIYTVDPDTGIGTDNAGKEVDLPQTGMSGAHKAIAGMAALMTLTGAALIKKSRKEDEE